MFHNVKTARVVIVEIFAESSTKSFLGRLAEIRYCKVQKCVK